jgi:nucleotide-binding universal stress UspA family protein
MQLRHILVATDQSDTARTALRVALTLANRAGARVTVMTTIPAQHPTSPGPAGVSGDPAASRGPVLARLEQWMDPEVRAAPPVHSVGLGVTFGIPGVEICRFADDHQVDLIVVGRKQRSQATRLLVGDTADAVARRSRTPCLFVPLGSPAPEHVLVALDGSRRGLTVLRAACDFAKAVSATLRAVTVEPVRPDEPPELAELIPSGRSDALRETIAQLADCEPAGHVPDALMVRRGPVVDSLITAAAETGSDVIVLGFHRGGPPGVIEAGSIARRLTHSAACPVLTVPF